VLMKGVVLDWLAEILNATKQTTRPRDVKTSKVDKRLSPRLDLRERKKMAERLIDV
jgi:hypothetical protein